jgi:hypothetical protein
MRRRLAARWLLALLPLAPLGCASVEWSAAPESTRRVFLSYEGRTEADLHVRGRLENAARTAGGVTLTWITACGGSMGHGDFAGFALAVCAAVAVAVAAPVGATVGAVQGLPSETADALNRSLPALVDESAVQRRFLERVSAELDARRERVETPAAADALLRVRLARIAIEPRGAGRLALALDATSMLERAGPQRHAILHPSRDAHWESEPTEPRLWLERDGAPFVAELERGLEALARDLTRETFSPGP